MSGASGFTKIMDATSGGEQTVTITADMSIHLLSIRCTTAAVAGKIKGGSNEPFGGTPSVEIDIPSTFPLNLESQFAPLDGYIIKAPVGCILNLVGQTG